MAWNSLIHSFLSQLQSKWNMNPKTILLDQQGCSTNTREWVCLSMPVYMPILGSRTGGCPVQAPFGPREVLSPPRPSSGGREGPYGPYLLLPRTLEAAMVGQQFFAAAYHGLDAAVRAEIGLCGKAGALLETVWFLVQIYI